VVSLELNQGNREDSSSHRSSWRVLTDLEQPIRAATETAIAHGIKPNRCDILQNGHTLVLRLTETLVARVVQDLDGPRQGTEWFARETAIAQHLTRHGAPVIPLHPDLPPGPHQHLGYPLNFWQFVTRIDSATDPGEIGRTLRQCHDILRTFPEPLPKLSILSESLAILDRPGTLPAATQQMLREHSPARLACSTAIAHRPLHGDAHMGNLLPTTRGAALDRLGRRLLRAGRMGSGVHYLECQSFRRRSRNGGRYPPVAMKAPSTIAPFSNA